MVEQHRLSELDQIIAPEIIDDEFHQLITRLCRSEPVKHVLEIGSSAGAGSTTAFIEGLRDNPQRPILFCMEISRPRFELLTKTYHAESFVRCFNVSSVSIDEFPTEQAVSEFYKSKKTALNQYPLERVLGWLRQDIEYVKSSGVPQSGIELIKREAGIDAFDMVLIDGSEFTGAAELNHVDGARVILLDDTNSFKCFVARKRLLGDPRYELIADNQRLRNGFSAFRLRDPARRTGASDGGPAVHFFTIVLNGEPFIRWHLDVFKSLPFRWHWHIVEGVAELKHDTAWSVANGGRIDPMLHDRGRSNDGTSAYLDEIARAWPDRITLYRQPRDRFWDGKRQMVAAPLANINQECLLWQVDADELWRPEQILAIRDMFQKHPERTAAYFWCDYFVGPEAVISTRYNYAQNPAQEWLRVWRFKPGDRWAAHEPPILKRPGASGGSEDDVAKIRPFLHDETESVGAVFQHFAYVTEEQLRFKEVYYGYRDAVHHWQRLQSALKYGKSVLLKDYFPWVRDDTMADSAGRTGVLPIARRDQATGNWYFASPAGHARQPPGAREPRLKVVVDGMFFQHFQTTGIARVWRALLKEWVASGFADHVVLLDRGGTAPRIPGLRYRPTTRWNEEQTAGDSFLLQRICDNECADVFVSSYYTSPIATPSIFVAHDMIPEKLGLKTKDQIWHEKHHAIRHAAAHICISQNTRRDLLELFPELSPERVNVIPVGVDPVFQPPTAAEIQKFRTKNCRGRPYFVAVGDRRGVGGYKNYSIFFRAFGGWAERHRFSIVCAGGHPEIEADFKALAPDADIVRLALSDEELRVAYAGATALVYPSRYEGFGMPVIEAMACGCPTITSSTSSLPEVGGDAALYFDPDDIEGLLGALKATLDESKRQQLIERGFARARLFNWQESARRYSQVFVETYEALKAGRISRPSPVWQALREEQGRNQRELAEMRRRLLMKAVRESATAGELIRNVASAQHRPLRDFVLRRFPPWTVALLRRLWHRWRSVSLARR